MSQPLGGLTSALPQGSAPLSTPQEAEQSPGPGQMLHAPHVGYDRGTTHGSGAENGEPHVSIAPIGGRLVVFESHIEHEVLPTQRPRYAITAWFHCAPLGKKQECTGPPASDKEKPGPSLPFESGLKKATRDLARSNGIDASAAACGLVGTSVVIDVTAAGGGADTRAVLNTDCITTMTESDPSTALESKVQRSSKEPKAAITSTSHGRQDAPVTHGSTAAGAHTGQHGAAPYVSHANERIFVSIVAYRDPECAWTIHDLLTKVGW